MSPDDVRTHLADYADGELDPVLREQIGTHLATHPGDQAEVARWQALRRSAHRALNDEPVPDGLAERVRARVCAQRGIPARRIYRFGVTGLAVAAAIVLGFVFWPRGAATPVDASGFARIYLNCAVTRKHDTFEIRDCQPGTTFARLKEKAGFPCSVPDLAAVGNYRLDGACRCSPTKGVRLVHAYFRDEQRPDDVVSVFAIDRHIELTSNGAVCPPLQVQQRHYHAATEGDVTVLNWDAGDRSYVLVGKMNSEKLMHMAEGLAVAQRSKYAPVPRPQLAEIGRY